MVVRSRDSQMSTQSKTCYECGTGFEESGYDDNDEVCSAECYYQRKGRKALKNLQSDHTLCPSCGTILKTTTGPSEDWKHKRGSHYELVLDRGAKLTNGVDGITLDVSDLPEIRPTEVESIIGYEFHTESATQGVDEIESDTHNIQFERVSCGNCGMVNPQDEPHKFLQNIDTAKVLTRIFRRLREKYDVGCLSSKIDKQRYFDGYKASNGDLVYAVGYGLGE